MTILIADCETDGLLDAMTRLWCIQLGDADGDDVTLYADQPGFPPLAAAIERLKAADHYVFHNGLSFDMAAINRFYPGTIEAEKLYDTVVMARLAFPLERGHSLGDWGKRLGEHKGDYKGDFQTFTPDLVQYAQQDITVGRKLFHHVKHVLTWGRCYEIESRVAQIMRQQEAYGFLFDREHAAKVEARLRQEAADQRAKLEAIFPPIERTTLFVPKVNNKKLGYVKGQQVLKSVLVPFNPASRQQIGERLIGLGWKPKVFGDTPRTAAIPKVDEKILSGLPYPEAKEISKFFVVNKKLGQLADGDEAWLRYVKADGRVHGAVNPMGACTGRMSHFRPNMAQVDGDHDMRACWVARSDRVLVGVDASGLEARMMAHYLWKYDQGAYAEAVSHGTKEEGTDEHSLNLARCKSVGVANRDTAKTLLYAYVYGAGDWKLGETVRQGCRDAGVKPPKLASATLGKLVRKVLGDAIVGLGKLAELVKKTAATRGYLVSLDGRHVPIRSPHSALNTLFQGAGAVVMKLALVRFYDEAARRYGPHGDKWGLCANVHDEVQFEIVPEWAEEAGQLFVQCIRDAGVELGVKCALDGEAQIGRNWSETH